MGLIVAHGVGRQELGDSKIRCCAIQDGDRTSDVGPGCVLFVPGLKYSVISILMIKKKGFEVLFHDGKARLRPRGSSFAGIVLGVREYGLYRLTGRPMDHEKQVEQVQVQALEEQVQVLKKKVQLPQKKVQIPETRGSRVLKGACRFRGRLCSPRRACGQWGARVLLQLPRRNHGEIGK